MNSKFGMLTVSLFAIGISGCNSGSSSSGAGEDASNCVTRTLSTVYVNDCNYDVNVIILKPDEKPFKVNRNSASTRSSTGAKFGACRAPSTPILNATNDGYVCS